MTPEEKKQWIANMTPEEKRAYIFSIQSPSMQATMLRKPEDDAAYQDWKLNTPIPLSAQVRDKDGNIDVGERETTVKERMLEKRLRYDRGEYIAEMRGEAEPSSVTPEKRSKAVEAFLFIKARFKDLMKFAGLANDEELARYKDEK